MDSTASPPTASDPSPLTERLRQLAGDRSEGWFARLRDGCEEAIAADPDHPLVLDLLGSVRIVEGRAADALPLLQRALEVTPRSVDVLTHLGDAHRRLGRDDLAADCYRRAIEIAPKFEALNNLADIAIAERSFEAARVLLVRAIECDSTTQVGWVNLGVALEGLGRYDDAMNAYESAARRAPGDPLVQHNIAHLLHSHGRLDEAVAAYRRAIEQMPDYPAARDLLGRPDVYELCTRFSPSFAAAVLNLSFSILSRGDFETGLRLMEWRWGTLPHQRQRHALAVPLWKGEPLGGKRLLVLAEQGLGDVVQFVRYAAQLADEAERVTLVAAAPVVRLLGGLHPKLQVIERLEPGTAHDLAVPILSLPRMLLERGAFAIPPDPYLRADPTLVARFGAALGPRREPRRVGIAWAGSALHARDHERSCRLSDLEALTRCRGWEIVSLQHGDRAEDLLSQPPARPVVNVMSQVSDLADTAAVIANLDAVVTVDTVVAHVSAAMGKPTWVVLGHPPDWRWGVGGSITPWYRSARLVRRLVNEPWPDVWRRAAESLV